MYIYIYIHTHSHTHTYIYVYMCVCVWVRACVRVCWFVRVLVCARAHVCNIYLQL